VLSIIRKCMSYHHQHLGVGGRVDDSRDQFLRDGKKLAAHMTGTIEVQGVSTFFESFMFAEVEEGSGKLEWMVERSIWGPQGGKAEHGET
jgi:hypothetical protein